MKFNWDGLLIEPHPICIDFLNNVLYPDTNVKICGKAVDITPGVTELRCGSPGCCGLHSINSDFINKTPEEYFSNEKITVQTDTLTNILDHYNIDFNFDILSIDCEGHDLYVLGSLDFEKYKPKLICIERDDPDNNSHILKTVRHLGYIDIHWTHSNIIFKRHDLLL